jgi:hypothetical protein
MPPLDIDTVNLNNLGNYQNANITVTGRLRTLLNDTLVLYGYGAAQSGAANNATTAIGYNAMFTATTGNNNTVVGYHAQYLGNPNNVVAIGSGALENNTISGAIAVGYHAAQNSSANILTIGTNSCLNNNSNNTINIGIISISFFPSLLIRLVIPI